MRLQRIRSLESSRQPLSLFDQIQLENERNTAANLRSESYKEGSALLEQGKLNQKMPALGLAQSGVDIARAGIGDVGQAGQRAYTFGREAEELERLRMANEGRRLQSQMSFLPQMEALRGGIASRMAGSLGVGLPSGDNRPYSSGTGYRPSWMQNYQTPRFPR